MDIKFLLDQFYNLCHIPVHLYNENNQELMYSRGFSDVDPWTADPLLLPTLLKEMGKSTLPYIDTESDMILTVLFPCPNGAVISLGPVCLYRDAAFLSKSYAQHHRLHEPLTLPTSNWFDLGNAISFIYYLLVGEKVDGQQLLHLDIDNNDQDVLNNSQFLDSYMLNNAENENSRYSYNQEMEKMHEVAEGNVDAIQSQITPEIIQQSQEMIGEMSEYPKKQWEYSVVSSIVLSCRAAISGGLPPTISYSLSDTLLQRLSRCENVQEMLSLQSEIRMTFAAYVKEYREQNSNISCVEKAKNYITSHLNCSFSLDELADSCYVNKYYLSRKFKEVTNQTITEYTHTRRMKIAEELLRYSTQSISNIADYLCYSSQSHFTEIFHKYTGLTPQQYRNQITK